VPAVLALAVAATQQARVVAAAYAQFDEVTRDFRAIVKLIPQAPKLLYLIYDHGGSQRTTTPFIHLPAYVQADRGGWLSFHFAIFDASPVAYRPRDAPGAVVPPPVPYRWEWLPHLYRHAEHGKFFDWFLVRRDKPPDFIFFSDPSVVRYARAGTWSLYKRKSAVPAAPSFDTGGPGQ
jgi:hypothetical protein